MKVKHIVPIVVGGVLGVGAAVSACCEIQRLKEIIEAQKKCEESCNKVISSQKTVIAKDKEYIAALEQVIEKKDALIAIQKKQIAVFQGNREAVDLPEPDSKPASPSEEPAPEPPKPKKPQNARQEYVFQYDTDFNVVGKYESFADATRAVGLKCQTSVGRAVSGRAAHAGGYFWSRGIRPLKNFPDKWKSTAEVLKNKREEN